MGSVLVLCYHAVSDTWPAALSVTPAMLRMQVGTLLARGWEATTFTSAVLEPPARKSLAVTFDDAFASVRSSAAPILDDLGVPGTVFVPTDFPGGALSWPRIDQWRDTVHRDELQALSWDELRSLRSSGWEIGSHTCSHPTLTTCDDEELDRELRISKAVCEAEVGPCRSLAYPFGDVDARVRAFARDAGYEVAAGLGREAFTTRDPMNWARIGVWHADPRWRFDVKATPLTSELRGLHGRFKRRLRALHHQS